MPSLKTVFAEATYPKEELTVPPRNLELSVDAAVLPSLMVDYREPRAAARCLFDVVQKERAIDAAWSYGGCLATGEPLEKCFGRLPWFEQSSPGDAEPPGGQRIGGCAGRLATPDRERLVLAYAEASASLYTYFLSTAGQGAQGSAFPSALRGAFKKSVRHAARLLERDPWQTHRVGAPVLALSGGAANGAFVAGYLRQLLWLRERAFVHGSAQFRKGLAGYRFSASFSSSVGTLISLPLDLYFAEITPTAAEAQALFACRSAVKGSPVDPSRPLEACAIAKLDSDFVRNEWELLCAQPGSVIRLIDPDLPSLLRFDPLFRNVVSPFFRDFRRLLQTGHFTRVAMAADIEQNVLVGLDERACSLRGMDATRCLESGVEASIVEPVFVPPVDRVYSGLGGPLGEKGTWLDGSLRSLNPGARAAQFALGKVLAVNTNRAEGVPSLRPSGPIALMLNSFDTLGAAQRSWELGYAELYQDRRATLVCQKELGLGALCAGASVSGLVHGNPSPGASRPAGNLYSVWVPEEVAPAGLFASGYAFDPLVMRGLFLWGQRELLRSRRQLLGFLGWCGIRALEQRQAGCALGTGVSPRFVAELAAEERRIESELAGYAKYADAALWQRHVDERRGLVEKNLSTCAP